MIGKYIIYVIILTYKNKKIKVDTKVNIWREIIGNFKNLDFFRIILLTAELLLEGLSYIFRGRIILCFIK